MSKTGQGSEIPALRADDLMKLVNTEQIVDITRVRFWTKTSTRCRKCLPIKHS